MTKDCPKLAKYKKLEMHTEYQITLRENAQERERIAIARAEKAESALEQATKNQIEMAGRITKAEARVAELETELADAKGCLTPDQRFYVLRSKRLREELAAKKEAPR